VSCHLTRLCEPMSRAVCRGLRHRHHPTRVASSSPSAVFSAPLVACSSATPSQLCDAISALRHHLSSATPSQLCDTTSALRHHLSSATPSQLCDTVSAPRHHLSSATPSAFPTGKRRYLCRKHLWQRCTRQRMIAVIGCIVCARRSLFPVAPADIATDRAICSGLWRWS